MREVIFRGKERGTGKWLYGDLQTVGHKRFIDGNRERGRVNPETVGQYIGIKDKNGCRIFEGDIIQTYFSFVPGDAGYGVSQKPFVVEWEQERTAFRARKPSACDLHLLDMVDFFETQRHLYEVIGNIHDNPDMVTV